MVSYYGNTATWQCRGALRPCLPCLRSALCIHAAETWMCLALLQGHSAMPLLPLCTSLLVFTDLDGIALSLHSQQSCSRPLVALHWDLYLALQTQKWTQSSRCGLTRYEQMGRITSLDLLVILYLTAVQFIFSLQSIKGTLLAPVLLGVHHDSRCYPAELLPSWLAPACSGAWVRSSPATKG